MVKLRAAVIGCGLFGNVHAQTYAACDQSELVLVCDRDELRAKKCAERFGCDYVTDADAVAADARVDVVSVVTPDFAHCQPCLAVVRAGKHLLVEKPLATSLEDARMIVEAAERAGVIAGVDFHNRYHPALRRVHDRLRAGKMGQPQTLHTRLNDRLEVATQWFSWASRSGPHWFLLPHLVDLADWLIGARPKRIYAQGTRGVLRDRGIDTWDTLQVQLSYGNAIACLEAGWIMPDAWPSVADFGVRLQTTTHRADLDGTNQGLQEAGPGPDQPYAHPFLWGQSMIGQDEAGYFGLPIRDFLHAVQRKQPAPVGLEQGLANVATIEAIVRSAQTDSPITMDF